MRESLELRQLRFVLALERHRHFGRAAKELGLSQSALSKNLRAIEDTLGVSLFDRDARQVAPTNFGTLVVNRARAILSGSQRLLTDIARLRQAEPLRVRFGSGPVWAASPVGIALSRYLTEFPAVSACPVVLGYEELLVRLRHGSIEFYVGLYPAAPEAEDLRIQPLRTRPSFVFCRAGHPLSSKDQISIDDVRGFPLATPSLAQRWRREVDGMRSDEHAAHSAPRVEVDSVSMVRSIVLHSDALGAGSHHSYAEDFRSGRLVRLPTAALPETRGAIVSLVEHPLSDFARDLIRMIHSADHAGTE